MLKSITLQSNRMYYNNMKRILLYLNKKQICKTTEASKRTQHHLNVQVNIFIHQFFCQYAFKYNKLTKREQIKIKVYQQHSIWY